jgi:hypothetical protein
VTRAEFAAAADTICKRQADVQRKALRRDFKRLGKPRSLRGLLRLESIYASRAARAIEGSHRGILALPVAPGDEVIVAQWLDSLHFDAVNARAAARLVRKRKVSFGRYFREVEQASAHSKATELLVDGFGMRECASNTRYSRAVSAGKVS